MSVYTFHRQFKVLLVPNALHNTTCFLFYLHNYRTCHNPNVPRWCHNPPLSSTQAYFQFDNISKILLYFVEFLDIHILHHAKENDKKLYLKI